MSEFLGFYLSDEDEKAVADVMKAALIEMVDTGAVTRKYEEKVTELAVKVADGWFFEYMDCEITPNGIDIWIQEGETTRSFSWDYLFEELQKTINVLENGEEFRQQIKAKFLEMADRLT